MSIKHRSKIKTHKMFIHWKSLIAFGLFFWILLCVTDLFGGNPRGYLYNVEDYDLLYETLFMERLQRSENIMLKLRNFGALLLLWNSVTFVCSMMVCQFAKSVWWLLFNAKFRKTYSTLRSSSSMRSINSNISKIPVKIKTSPVTCLQVLDLKKRLSLKSEGSCPNFLNERTRSNLSDNTTKSSPKCHTLFKNNNMFIPTREGPFMDSRQITKLRAEIIRLQSKFQKEQSELARKIDIVNREKKDVSKQLSVVHKENRAAKQQIEELAQEKAMLLKKLESATKDIKSNTKSKKAALTKLEELTVYSEKLKQELEQVSRDKVILENKLKVLQSEYENLQERIILPTETNFCENYHVNTPERDTNTKNSGNSVQNLDINDKNHNTLCGAEMKNEQQSVSQTELDMKNIQVKIKQLEKNLENFNVKKPEFDFQETDQGELDLNLSMVESKRVYEDDPETYEYFFPNANPRLRYWSGRAGDVVSVRPSVILIDSKSQSASVIQSLASKMNEKVRYLDNIREKCETELDEYSSHESLDDELRTPRRIVSNSVAFQKFLKNLQPDSSRSPYDSQSEYCF